MRHGTLNAGMLSISLVRPAGMQAKELTLNRLLRCGVAAFCCLHVHSVMSADDSVVVTATRFPERELDVPVGMTVIRSDTISSNTARTLPELLAREAGIMARDSSGSPDRQIDMRGFGITGDQNTLVLVDGQRLNDIELNTVRWSSIPLESIDRIEILRGSGAVLYGGGAGGGTINIITKSASSGRNRAALTTATGSNGIHEVQVTGNLSQGGLGAGLHYSEQTADNFRANNRLEQYNAMSELRLAGSETYVALKLSAESQSLRLPGERTAAELQSDPRGTRRPGDYSSRDGNHVLISGGFRLGAGEFAAELGHRDSVRTSLLRDYTFGVFDTYTDTRTKVWNFTPRLKLPLELLGYRHSLVAGLDFDDWDYDSRRAGAFNMLDAPVARIQAVQRDTAVYMQDQIAVGQSTKLSAGYRQQRVWMQARDIVNPAAYASGSRLYRPKAWELAIRHEVNPSTAVYARSGKSFRTATVDEVYSQFGGPFFDSAVTLLAPQTSRDREAGMEYRIGTLRARASAFGMNLDNEIYFFFPAFSNINLPPTRRRGLELEAGYEPMPGLLLNANLTFNDARFRSGTIAGVDVSGKRIPLVPERLANVGVTWRVAEHWKFTAGAKHVGHQIYDNDQANTFPGRMPSYSVFDARVLTDRDAWSLSLAANNLLDKRYYNYAIRNGAGTSFNAYPQVGRTFMATLQLRI